MKNKGFTLIELLAVIIIIAIIAVITIPKINSIIKQAQLGIAKDSAYGYKKAVDNYYYDKLVNKEKIKLDGAYKVNNIGELFNDYDIHAIRFDGNSPSDGLLVYNNNELDNGCLTINKYKIEFVNGEVSTITKGNCNTQELQIALSCDSSYNASPESWFEFDSSSGELKGFINKDETNTDGWNGEKDIVIPCSINGTRVTKIANRSFDNKGLDSVVIPTTVTKIGANTFANNNLTNINIPNSVTEIGSQAFKNNNIQNINIPNSITKIENNAFSDNKLKEVVIPNSLTTIESGVFENNLISSLKLSDSVIKIDSRAFSNNSISSVNLPASLKEIGAYAFYKNLLTDIDIPASVNVIDIASFNDNALPDSKAFIFARKNDGSEDKTILVSYGGINKNITIPSTVQTLESYSLYDNKLETITLNSGLKTIKQNAIASNQLEGIEIPNTVTDIQAFALAYNKISTINIPDTVKNIDIAVLNGNLLPDDQAFIYARNDGVTDNTVLISYGGAKKDNVSLPTSIQTIENRAFYSTDLNSIVLDDNLSTIKNSAFLKNNLTTITIPSNVTTIEDMALSGNQSLTTVTNTTGRSFLWDAIFGVGNNTSVEFETGTVDNNGTTVTISAS
ncbi:MAG: leucine-rich repeat domain-containing protein [Bacilli bacterium]|nr:leucine-rich repeat domain-containing protein [Bacilli bacterium]